MTLTMRIMQLDDLESILFIERKSHLFPWSRENFYSSIQANYLCWCMHDAQQNIHAYIVAMPGVDELHILNITVSPEYRRQGYGCYLLDIASQFARKNAIEKILLEVRESNHNALMFYQRYGFDEIGRRPGYYPSLTAARETAIVLAYKL